jgi:hypothetical protein
MMIRTYTELSKIQGFKERFDYLALSASVGVSTFGFDRHLNQRLYTSRQWRDLRSYVIVRDNGCDLGVDEFEIHDRVYIHHMNPVTVHDLTHGNDDVFDPEFLITTTHRTHNAIHYGDRELLPREYKPRRSGDTKLW